MPSGHPRDIIFLLSGVRKLHTSPRAIPSALMSAIRRLYLIFIAQKCYHICIGYARLLCRVVRLRRTCDLRFMKTVDGADAMTNDKQEIFSCMVHGNVVLSG